LTYDARLLLACSLFCAFTASCKREASKSDTTAAASAPTSASSASAAAPVQDKPWYEGSWRGRYEARHFKIEMTKPQGAVKEWASDNGKQASGSGEINLKIDGAGQVSGTGQGPLGAMVATGEVDGDMLRVKLQPVDPGAENALGGFLLASRKGDAFAGKLQASSGDSLLVRDAPVELAKEGGSAAPR
jgi:hypothetical protein